MKETVIRELEFDPAFIRKRRLMMFALIVRMFLMGVEYSVILPSVWLYVQTFNMDTWFMGMVVASYPFSAMLSLPIAGHIYDNIRRTREIILVLNLFQVVGNIMYAVPFSIWLPLCGRFLAGIGDGFLACAIGEVTVVYPEKYRTGIFSLLELGRVIGLILGPTLNFFIAKAEFTIWTWRLDYATLPGVIMAVGWLLYCGVTLCCIFNLSKDVLQKDSESNGLLSEMSDHEDSIPPMKSPVDGETLLYGDSLDENYNADSESNDLLAGEVPIDSTEKVNGWVKKEKIPEPLNIASEPKAAPSVSEILLGMVAFDFFVIFYVDIVLWLGQTEFEILLPLVTEREYKWHQQSVGLVYMIGGVELVIIFGLIYFLGHKYPIRDTYLLLLSLFFTMVAMAFMILETKVYPLLDREYVFCAICVLVFASIPLNLVASKALLTKIVDAESQGLVQGLYSSITRVALIAGPLLGSVAFHDRVVFGVVMSSLCFAGIVGLIVALPKLRSRQDAMHIKKCCDDD